jgi:ribosome-associated protein
MADDDIIPINNSVNIPKSELEFRFSTSSGPGGQHANRSATRVTLLFDVVHSPALDEVSRSHLLARLATRLDKQGILQIHVQESRSQQQNRELAISRFQRILSEALKPRKPRRATKPSRAAIDKRLAEKKQRARLKQDRGKLWG